MEKLCSQHPPKASGMRSYPVLMQGKTVDIDLGNVVHRDTWQLCHEFGKQGNGPGEFESARGIAAAAEPDEIAVADWKNERVVIFNYQEHTYRSIPVIANDVAALVSQWVVISPTLVKVYNKDNTLAFEFNPVPQSEAGMADVQLVSVAVKENGNIIVGDTERKVLTEHSLPDRSLIYTMPVEIEPDYLTVINDTILISDWKQGRVDMVDVVDGKAETRSTINPTIGGQPVKYCRGVCSNSSGIYIVVDSGTDNSGHIHHYDCRGQFVSCVAQGLYQPSGITFTLWNHNHIHEQQLVVADFHSVRMYHKV